MVSYTKHRENKHTVMEVEGGHTEMARNTQGIFWWALEELFC